MVYVWVMLSGCWIAVLMQVTGYEDTFYKLTTLDPGFRRDDVLEQLPSTSQSRSESE